MCEAEDYKFVVDYEEVEVMTVAEILKSEAFDLKVLPKCQEIVLLLTEQPRSLQSVGYISTAQ